MKKRYMFFVIFFLESCDLKLKPSVEFHAFHFSDGSLSTEKFFADPNSNHHIVVSNPIDWQSTEGANNVVKFTWSKHDGSVVRVFSESDAFQCSWGPPDIGPRKDLAFPVKIEGNGVGILEGFHLVFPQNLGVWITEASP